MDTTSLHPRPLQARSDFQALGQRVLATESHSDRVVTHTLMYTHSPAQISGKGYTGLCVLHFQVSSLSSSPCAVMQLLERVSLAKV
jgi:hypothetical protein